MIEQVLLLISVLIFVLITIIFASTYYKKILYAQREYDTAKEFVSGIVLTFKRRMEKQDEKIDGIAYNVEGLQSAEEQGEKQDHVLQVKINNLTKSLTSVFMINKTIVNNLLSVRKTVDGLKTAHEEVRKKIEFLEAEHQKTLQKPEFKKESEQKPTSTSLTSTEDQIIQILLSEGAKSAPEIEKRIGKTREHTSRLMKKLWQQGYIERDTHAIPFIYRPTKELKMKVQT